MIGEPNPHIAEGAAMPLLDHFHPPLFPQRHWESFHTRWANSLADALNEELLPPNYYAEVQTHLGPRVEVDVATLERGSTADFARPNGAATATLAPKAWSPPAPTLTMPAVFPH